MGVSSSGEGFYIILPPSIITLLKYLVQISELYNYSTSDIKGS